MDLEHFSSVDRDNLRNRIVERLKNEANQKALANLIMAYYVDTRAIATTAETLADGMRFNGLANEVYACFQHISRGLAEDAPDVNALAEFDKAENSHLKRLRLDAHKIVINRALEDARPILDSVDFLSSNSEIIKFLPDGNENINRVRKLRKELRASYLQAKRAEGKGDPNALDHYREAGQYAVQLLGEVEYFICTNEVLFAIKREEEKRLQALESIDVAKEANDISRRAGTTSKWSIGVAIVSVCIALGALLWGIYKDSRDDKAASSDQKSVVEGSGKMDRKPAVPTPPSK